MSIDHTLQSGAAGGGARVAGVLLGLVGALMFALLVVGFAAHNRDSATTVLSAADTAAQVAAVDRWTPSPAVGGHAWHTAGRITGSQRTDGCDEHPVQWTWVNGTGLQLSLVRLACSTPYAAYEVANNYAGTMTDIDFPDSGEHYTWIYHDERVAQIVWRQRGAMLALHLVCGPPTPTCLRSAGALAEQVDSIGGAAGKDDPRTGSNVGYVLAPLTIWLILVAPVRVVQLARRQRWESVDSWPRYRDLTPILGRRRRDRILRLVLWAVATVASVLCGLSLCDWLITAGNYAIGTSVSGLVGAVAYVLGRRLDPGRRTRAPEVARRGGRRGRAGQVLRTWSTVLVWTALVGYVVVVLAGGGARTIVFDRLYYNLSQSSRGSSVAAALRWIFVTLALGYRDDVVTVIVFAVLPTLLIAYLLRTLGRRLQAADAADLRRADGRAPFVYLRSFDDDRLRIPAPSLRSGPVERLIPWRRRSFESVVVDVLSRYGPVVTVGDPRVHLAPLGAARAELSHDAWQAQVTAWAQDSLAVVVGATPAQVRAGFEYELSMLAAVPRPRLLLVQAPLRHAELGRRWAAFCHQVSGLPLFAPLVGGWVQPGTHVIAHDGVRGWTAWGARRRTDRSYAVAIEAAVREQLPAWFQGYVDTSGRTR